MTDQTPLFKRVMRSATGVLFPPRCIGCSAYLRGDGCTCERCAHTVFVLEGPLCRICGHPRRGLSNGYAGIDEVCARCLRCRPHFERARGRWEYAGTIADALQAAKYRRQLWIARRLAARLRPWLHRRIEALAGEQPVVATAVPMHRRDLRRRGFNLAALMLRLMRPQVSFDDVLVHKVEHTAAQAGLSRVERLANLRGAFECPRPDAVGGKTVVVFDDVMTTGATASAVARALKRAGAARTEVFTAARATLE